METHSGTRDDLLCLLERFGIRSAQGGISMVDYNQALSKMVHHLSNNNIDTKPGTVTRVLLEAIASAMTQK